MNIYGIVTVASLVIYLFIGVCSSRSVKNTDDFYVMGRNAPAPLITGTLIATNISTVAFIGYVGSVYTQGALPYITMFGATLASSIFLGLSMGRYIRRMHLYTVPDFFVKRYPDNESVKLLSTAIVLFTMLVLLISVCQGVTVVLCGTFGISRTAALVISLGTITVFTMCGGMKGVVVTDTIMFVTFFVAAMLVAPYLMKALGGWPLGISRGEAALPYVTSWKGSFSTFDGIWQYLEVNCASVVLVLASPQLLSRAFIAKSEKTLGRAMLLQALLFPIFIFTLLFLFSLLPMVRGDLEPTSAFIWAAMNLASPVVGALALAGITAAALSSASSLFQQAAAALSRDIYERYINPTADEKKKMQVSRICVLLIAVFCFLGSTSQDISALGIVYGFLFATAGWAAWFPPLILGIYWKRATTKAAALSMAFGFLVTIGLVMGRTHGLTPSWLAPNVAGLAVSAAVCVAVSLATSAGEAELAVFETMRREDLT